MTNVNGLRFWCFWSKTWDCFHLCFFITLIDHFYSRNSIQAKCWDAWEATKKNSTLFDHHLHEIFEPHSGTDYRTGPNFPNTSANTTPIPQHTPGRKHTVLPIPLSFPTWNWCLTSCVKHSYTWAETKSTSIPRGWTVLATSYLMRVSMCAWIRCRRSGIGDNPATITMSRDFLDSFNIWCISCQILLHTHHPYRCVSETGSHSYGPHSSTSVLSLSKHSLARLWYWSLLMQATQSLSGLYAMAPSLESGPCMGKAQTGNPAIQQASYQRSSVLCSRTIILMNIRRLLSSKHLLSGRISY